MSMNTKYTKEYLEPLVKDSRYFGELFEKIGIINGGANYTNIKNKLIEYKIDYSHFVTKNKAISLKKSIGKLGQKDLLIKNCQHGRRLVKLFIYDNNILPIKCAFCDQGEVWKGKHMSLILDHKNGIRNDNRLKNLRLLCPNCNATLDTHCNKNNNK